MSANLEKQHFVHIVVLIKLNLFIVSHTFCGTCTLKLQKCISLKLCPWLKYCLFHLHLWVSHKCYKSNPNISNEVSLPMFFTLCWFIKSVAHTRPLFFSPKLCYPYPKYISSNYFSIPVLTLIGKIINYLSLNVTNQIARN